MTTINEQKLPRFMNVDAMGDIFKVPMCCIKRIPLLGAIAEEHPDQTIEIDEVSPDFFVLLVDFLKNRNETKFLESIKIFRKEDVDYWAKYLCIDDFFWNDAPKSKIANKTNDIPKPNYIGNKLVVVDAEYTKILGNKGQPIVFILNNGDRVSSIDKFNTIVPISGQKYNIDGRDGIFIKKKDLFIPLRDTVFDNDQYYISLINAAAHKLINNHHLIEYIF